MLKSPSYCDIIIALQLLSQTITSLLYNILYPIYPNEKGVLMRIKKNDSFRVTAPAVISGILLGLALIPLTILISALPYYAYITKPVYIFLPVLFFILLALYLLAAAALRRRKRYTVLFFSGAFSLLFPFLTALTFTFGYPHVHQTLYIELMKWANLFVTAKRFSMTPAKGHYLLGLASMLPGILLGILLLSSYFNKKRITDAEYHQPKKKNYYYI